MDKWLKTVQPKPRVATEDCTSTTNEAPAVGTECSGHTGVISRSDASWSSTGADWCRQTVSLTQTFRN